MEREIKWTEAVLQDMETTFDFYDHRNDTTQYSEYLFSQIVSSISRVAINPLIGHLTEYPHVRYVVVVPNYSVFYHFNTEHVTVLVLWDNRRNPNRLNYIFRNTDPMYFCEEPVLYKTNI